MFKQKNEIRRRKKNKVMVLSLRITKPKDPVLASKCIAEFEPGRSIFSCLTFKPADEKCL